MNVPQMIWDMGIGEPLFDMFIGVLRSEKVAVAKYLYWTDSTPGIVIGPISLLSLLPSIAIGPISSCILLEICPSVMMIIIIFMILMMMIMMMMMMMIIAFIQRLFSQPPMPQAGTIICLTFAKIYSTSSSSSSSVSFSPLSDYLS